jgi:hypothetical protein
MLIALNLCTKVNLPLGSVRNPKAYLLWAIVIAGAGLLISLVSTAQLLSWLVVQSFVPPTFWRMPLALLIVSCLCIVASIVLVGMALMARGKK